MNEGGRQGLAEIRSKLDLIRRVEAEHHFGVTIEGPRELVPIPELPEGVTDVFGLFYRLGGDFFIFRQPGEIASPDAWAGRTINPYCPLGSPLTIGRERHGIPADAYDEIEGGNGISLDAEDGSVFFMDGDDYVFAYENADDDEELDVTELSSDIVSFFNVHVLGGGYPELIRAVLGRDAVTRRDRKGRHRDSWMRLLTESGLV
ncbi:hypothetical protein [Actinomadura sp. HBU206391]|uniref:hypothetical protein n=1 Tax=Actinomadura sp. HBU206391 TaxID=2731692 RepID=UPI00164F9413|nr:hypothetical protein [Actinomadura sp. HBU206391]MBC6456546.1 hypothetical protein [Actinomadura sp. HBU206391]